MKNKRILRSFHISRLRFDADKINALIFVKEGRPLVKILLNSVIPMGGRRTSNWARIMVLYLRQLNRLFRAGGRPYVVKYMKACQVLLQQVSAGYVISDTGPLGCRISRDRSGFPRIIPSFQRKLIRRGDKRVLRVWLTLFSLYRNINYPGVLKLSTITDSSTQTSRISDIYKYIPDFAKLFPEISVESLSEYGRLFPLYSSGPQVKTNLGEYNSHSLSLKRTHYTLTKEGLSDTLLSIARISGHSPLLSLWSNIIPLESSGFNGKLSIKEEGAGKVRLFAMVDPWTQWALYPLHKVIFSILRKLPMDGTFNQEKALSRVPFGSVPLFSYDLSSATDRLPISLQSNILSHLFNDELSTHWVKLMVARKYKTPSLSELGDRSLIYKKPHPVFVRYTVGQPMGALSSWAMLALTHHYIVQYCAWFSGVVPRGTLFTAYAVLGDDILIWNRQVASRYLKVLKTLGVEVGLAKSIISEEGKGVEFAKRTVIEGTDVSPIPFIEQSTAHRNFSSLRSFMNKYSLTPNEAIRFLGYGYKVDITKNNSIAHKLRLGLTLPQSSNEMYLLFRSFILDRPYFEFKMSHFVPKSKVYKVFFDTVIKHLQNNFNRSSDLKWKFLQMSASTYVASVGPWATEEARIHRSLYLESYKKAHDEVTLVRDQISALLKSPKILWLREFYSGWLWELPFSTPEDIFQTMRPLLHIWFESEEVLAKNQISRFSKPKYKPSVSSIFLEEASALRAWHRWEMTLSKVTGLPDRAVNQNPLHRKRW